MIRITGAEGIKLDSHIEVPLSSNLKVAQKWMYLYEDYTRLWTEREDYTGAHLPHYLNYFMIHLLDGYLQTGEY